MTNAHPLRQICLGRDAGITSINLTADATRIELPDGSMVTGQTHSPEATARRETWPTPCWPPTRRAMP